MGDVERDLGGLNQGVAVSTDGRSAALRAEPLAASQAEPAATNAGLLWPVYEFRPIEAHMRGRVLRYADGAWLPDDGAWDIAFISYGMGAPLGLYVRLPYQRNIIWSGLTTHWRGCVAEHPNGNPWHYMLREGETEWGGSWGRDIHPNERAGREAMSKCCALNGCANGRGPEFEFGNKYIEMELVRERDTKRVLRPPQNLSCMFCGEAWPAAIMSAWNAEQRAASVDTHPKGGDGEAAPFMSGAVGAAETPNLTSDTRP